MIEIDLSRFVRGTVYVLPITIPNPKRDKRIKGGGDTLSAYDELPAGLQLVLDIVMTRQRQAGGAVRTDRLYHWYARHSGHDWHYFKLEAREVSFTDDWRFITLEADEADTTAPERRVYVLPHANYSHEHHQIVLTALNALVPAPITLQTLAAQAAQFNASGWDIIHRLIERGIVSLANVETSIAAAVAADTDDRDANIREHEATREGIQ
jgi:hypothetical protein